MQANHKKNNIRPNSFQKARPSLNKNQNYQAKSLLEKIASNRSVPQKQNHHTGKLVITKLNDYVEDKCHYTSSCAHLRADAKCLFLHEKRDYEALNIPLPEKFLENQQPLKKSKQQRKEDKIKQRAQRGQRLKEKLERQQNKERQDKHQKRQKQERQEKQEMQEQQNKKIAVKIVKQKIIDQKQILIQKILKTQNGTALTLGHVYEQLNLISNAYCHQQFNTYQNEFDLKGLKMSMFQIRKRLLIKFKKNKQYETLQKHFIQKQGGFIKKLIKNIFNACPNLIESVKSLQKTQSLDLRQIQQSFTLQDVVRVLKSRKQNQAIIEYYFRLFKENYGFPISFELPQNQQGEISLNHGNLLPLKKYQLLPIISPNFQFQRIFLSLDISFTQLKALSEFASLLIPQIIAEKSPVQKTFVIDISEISYNKFVDQILTEYLADYHQKMKGPAKEFQFGKLQDNLTKFRNFLAKYKSKIESQNKQNSFVLIVYNIKSLLDQIEGLGLSQNLTYELIKKDRTLDEQKAYEKCFLIREFIKIIGQNSEKKLKVVYVNNGKKIKFKKYKDILESLDQGLQEKQLLAAQEKMQTQ